MMPAKSYLKKRLWFRLRVVHQVSQQHLAEHLGISRSALNMAERRQRFLPTAALLKLHRIENALSNAENSKAKFAPSEKLQVRLQKKREKSKEHQTNRLAHCKYFSSKFKAELEEMKKQYNNTQLWITALTELRTDVTERTEWYDLQLQAAAKRLLQNDLVAQEKLELKIMLLAAEQSYISKKLGKT